MTLSTGENGVFRLTPTFVDQYAQFEIIQRNSDVQYGCWHELAGSKIDRLKIQLGYRRSRDFDKTDSPGQDFAVARCNLAHFVGLVADGVSQSYFGDLAAQHLGTHLLELLWNTRQQPLTAPDLEHELKLMQESLAQVVAGHHVEHLPEAVRHALERTRALGSQAVFAAAIWDLHTHRLTAYRVGDVRLWIRSADSTTEINADPTGRFSSAGRSQLKLASQQLLCTGGVFMKTDGVALNWGNDCNFDEINEDSFAAMANDRADIDDVSFLVAALDRSERIEFKNTLLLLPSVPLPSSPEARPVPPLPTQLPPQTGHGSRRGFLVGAFCGFLAASILLFGLFLINTLRLRHSARVRPSPAPISQSNPAQAVTPVPDSNNTGKSPSIEFTSEAIPRKLFIARHESEFPPAIRAFLKQHASAIVVRLPQKDNAGQPVTVALDQGSDQQTVVGQSTKNPNTSFFAVNPRSLPMDVRITATLGTHSVDNKLSLTTGNCYHVSVQAK